MTSSDRPVIRLKPKSDARRFRRRFPWIYDNELVLDRRTRSLAPGRIVRLEDDARQPIATATISPASRIVARLLDFDAEARVDRAWLAAGLRTALAHRTRVYDTPLYRLSHAEADGLHRFRAARRRGIGRAGRRGQIVHTGFAGPDHPVHPALAESGYLKALFLRRLP